MNRKEGTLNGLGIGAGLVVALGAISILVKTGWSGFGHPRIIPGPASARNAQAVRAQPVPLPEDFDELCRLAGI
jgi:hypothetical protein